MKTYLVMSFAAGALALLPGCVEAAEPGREGARATPQPPRKPFVSDRIAVTVRGIGRDVVLIHGVNGSTAVWNSTVKAVPGYRYHLVQIAGFAGVAPGGNARGKVVAPVADEIARYIGHKRLARPAVIGHSMGGAIALMLASRHPSRVGKAMVVDILPSAAGILGGTAASIAPLADSLLALAGTAEGQKLFERFGGGSSTSDRGVTSRALHELAVTDLSGELPRIAAPLTVVYATPRTTPDRVRLVTRTYTRGYAGAKAAKLVPVANSGHMVMYDQPSEFIAAVKAFLN